MTQSIYTNINRLIDSTEIEITKNDTYEGKDIYHYTNNEAFINIIKKNELWATHAMYLNDPEEIKYSVSLVKEIGADVCATKSNEASSQLAAALDKMDDYFNFQDFYVISFSECNDNLNQWRGYGKEYKSISIGYSFDELNKIAKKQEAIAYLCKIIYEPEVQKKIIREYIANAIDVLDDSLMDYDELNYAIEMTLYLLFKMGIRFKHPCWSEEREWRLVIINGRTIDFQNETSKAFPSKFYRTNEFSIIPFTKFSFANPNLAVSSVTVPYHYQAKKNINAIKSILNDFHYPVDKICISESDVKINY